MTNPFEDKNSTREGALALSFAEQGQWLTGERLKTLADYWRQTLVDAPVLLTLPTDRPRPLQQSFAGASITIHIDPELTQGLKSMSQEHSATLSMTLLTAWVVVLARLSGQQDIMVGNHSAKRGRPETEHLNGLFVNTLALRIDLSDQPSLAELLARVRAATLAAQDHQDMPFEQVAEIAQPPRRLEHTPLFQVMFAWRQRNDEQNYRLAGLSVEPVDLADDFAKFDLELSLREDDGSIVGKLVYATALFDAATIERQRGYLLSVLRVMVTQPMEPIMRIDLLDSQERELLLNTWNQTEVPYPEDRCIHELFEEQVRRNPEATAVVFQDQSLTYGELNTQANRLAHRLIDLGVQPDKRVAICVERGLAMVVGLFAILKAGGSYVPLDPNYPSQRLSYMLEDAQPAVLLVDTAGHESLGELVVKQPVIALDTDQADWAGLPAVNPRPGSLGLSPSNLAYVIYTSGSSGAPKGVMVEHRNVVNIVSHVIRVWDLSCNDVVLQFAAPAFDASAEEIFGALLSGAKLVLRIGNCIPNPLECWRLCDDARVTIVDLPTRFFDVAVKNAPGSIPSSIRLLVIGGDAVGKQTLENWFKIPDNHAQLWNTYGPTECTVESSIGLIRAEDLFPHIGRPTANTRIYILDEYGGSVPLGVIGEIFIGGAGVARGYLNLPGLTSGRFLRDPFSSTPGARVYRTGDLARYLPDGNIQFIGRNDSQVKIRGFRIEPEEIESRLIQHPAISKAVIIAREDKLGDKRLVAYVVTNSRDSKELLARTLRNYLSAALPDYMLPSAFVCLEAIPLNSNGKLNVIALPVPDEQSYAHQAYEPPQGELEATLAEVWGEILGLEQISRYDNFFELGGHSLLAVELLERLRQRGLGMEIRSLFCSPILSELARNLGNQWNARVPPNVITHETNAITPEMLPLVDLTQKEIDEVVRVTPGGIANIQDIYPLSVLQDAILFQHILSPERDPCLSSSLIAFSKRNLLNQYLGAVQQLIDRHDILRTGFIWELLRMPVQVVWRHAPLSVSEVTLDVEKGPVSVRLGECFDPRHYQMDLTRPPLSKYLIAHDSGGDRWLLLVLQHQIVSDHFAANIQREEIWAILSGRAWMLPPPQPFRNLVAQTRRGMENNEHEEFFRRMLGDIDEATLPFGISDVRCDAGRLTLSNPVTLDSELSRLLRAQARRLGVSVASLCHIAWARVVGAASGRKRVVFGTVPCGRMNAAAGSDRAIGPFMNILPIRLEIDDTSVEESVWQTHGKLAGLLRHEQASLAMAQRCSAVKPPCPLFSAVFNYRHVIHSQRDISIAISGVEFLGEHYCTNYPITMSVNDSGEGLTLVGQALEPHSPEILCHCMRQALTSLAAALDKAPHTSVAELEVVPPSEWELSGNHP
jgi:amino acid adenylation domain-containing protein